MKWILGIALLAVLFIVSREVVHVSREIQQESLLDEAQPADAIIVLGAAEYRGRPSPVLEARLNHALILYLKGLAPRVITTGGAGGDPVFTEGSVGRSYLTAHGVPPEAIVVEREGESTAQSVAAVVEIMRRMNLQSAIVVSDGYHIFRVKKMLESKSSSARRISRRAVLRGAGVTMALPWLPSLSAFADTNTPADTNSMGAMNSMDTNATNAPSNSPS